MNDHDPLPAPPEAEPLDDATRARMRARVVDGITMTGARGPRPWLVPGAAAAAVLVVAGAATGLALGSIPQDSDDAGVADDPARSHSAAPTTEVPTPSSGEPTPPDAGCEQEVPGVLRGAEPVATASSETGTTTFYVAGDQWTLCSTHGGRATVHRPGRLTAPDAPETYGVSSVYPARDTSTYVAGGVLPDGVTDATITYAFPDGHDERATLVSGDDGRTWWAMEYTVTGGELNSGNTLRLDPVAVDVAYGDVDETYELDWALDTCLQANHGC